MNPWVCFCHQSVVCIGPPDRGFLTLGIEISDETLMLEAIDEIGPGGEFLSSAETARLCRKEIWVPELADRESWTMWEQKGSLTMTDRIKLKVKNLIASHNPHPLPDGVPEKIEAILARAEKRFNGP